MSLLLLLPTREGSYCRSTNSSSFRPPPLRQRLLVVVHLSRFSRSYCSDPAGGGGDGASTPVLLWTPFIMAQSPHLARVLGLVGKSISWYPGHMLKAQREMTARLPFVDLLVEVRDARVPVTSQCPSIAAGQDAKPRVVLFHKCDLLDDRSKLQLKSSGLLLSGGAMDCLLTSAQERRLMRQLLERLVAASHRKRAEFRSAGTVCMVVGIPNCGKSSILNSLRGLSSKSAVAAVANKPGITRSSRSFLVREQPQEIWMVDSPGIGLPKITDTESGLKLALTGAVPDHAVDAVQVADYLLYQLGRNWPECGKAVTTFCSAELDQGMDRIDRVLEAVIARYGIAAGSKRSGTAPELSTPFHVFDGDCDDGNPSALRESQGQDFAMYPSWAYSKAAQMLVRAFREGFLGKFCLDDLALLTTRS